MAKKLSTFIAELTALQDKIGDVDVVICNNDENDPQMCIPLCSKAKDEDQHTSALIYTGGIS